MKKFKMTTMHWLIIAIVVIAVLQAILLMRFDGGHNRLAVEGCKVIRKDAPTVGWIAGDIAWLPGKTCYRCPDGREECI